MNNIRVRLPRKLAKSVSGGVLAEEGRLNPVGAMGITLNMLPVHRVTMTLSEKDLSLAMHDLVEVYNHKGSVGIYRVTKIPHTIGKNRKYELSHGLDVLSDATFDMIEEYKGTVDGMLAKIINAQTQMIGGVKYWQLGTCEDTNPWNKDIKYDNLMECLTEIAKKEEDYMFTFDQSTFPWTLNFVARDSTVLSEFRLNRNTENCVVTEDDADLCTRLYLSVTSETNDDEGHGTYINEGYFTYNDTDAQNAGFGVVCKTAGVNQEDFTSQAALEAWVAAYFGRHNRPGVQITIDGVELNKITGESIDEVHLSRICRVALPEYSCTFNERIVSVNYPDALRKPTYVRNSLANKRQTAEDAFSEIKNTATSASKSAGGAGRSAHNDATYFRRTIGDTANGLYSRIEQTAYYIRSEVVDTANGLYSKIEQTASYIRSEVANTANGLNSKIEQTASYIRSEVSNTANGLNSKIEQTASYIRSEVSDTANGLSSRISQNASAISLRVTKGDVGTQLAVELGNVTISGGNLVVDGYVTAAGLDAAIANLDVVHVKSIQAAAGGQGNLSLTSVTAQSSLYVGMEAGSVELISAGIRDAVTDLQLTHTSGTATYTLQKKTISSHSDWTDVGTFSKAATLSVEYGGDNTGDTATFTVTGTPEENFPSGNSATGTFTVHQSKDAAYITDANGTIRARIDNPQYANGWAAAYAEVSLPTTSSTASSFSVKTPKSSVDGGANTETYTASSATNDVVVVKNIAGTVVARLEHGKYTAGYTDGNAHRASSYDFSQAGDSDTAQLELDYNTKYKFQSKYQLADGSWANGSAYVVLTKTDRYDTGYNNGYNNGGATGWMDYRFKAIEAGVDTSGWRNESGTGHIGYSQEMCIRYRKADGTYGYVPAYWKTPPDRYTDGYNAGYSAGASVDEDDISITTDSTGYTGKPSNATEIWSSRPGFESQKWYKFKVTVKGATKWYAFYAKRA